MHNAKIYQLVYVCSVMVNPWVYRNKAFHNKDKKICHFVTDWKHSNCCATLYTSLTKCSILLTFILLLFHGHSLQTGFKMYIYRIRFFLFKAAKCDMNTGLLHVCSFLVVLIQ